MLNAREDHLAQFHNLKMPELYAKGLGWMVSHHEIVYSSQLYMVKQFVYSRH
jgi:hypothetical protein